eukprot:COSAG03_NODE_1147_length_4711_cov_3.503469_5_plen_111_part_00
MAASSDPSEAAAGKTVEMISFHSVSKGFIGECGIRGGYFELHNIDDAVKQNLYKLASISLCSNTHGQVPQQHADNLSSWLTQCASLTRSLGTCAVCLSVCLSGVCSSQLG